MNYNKEKLIHNRKSFKRDELLSLLERFQFNNLARMELFLWDLEIYLQIQAILGDEIVLKGGAATQFYLPIDNQRTSVDIDLICMSNKEKIEKTLQRIEKTFEGKNNLFKFKPHKPKKAKTQLPLLTYYVSVPSVCTNKDFVGGDSGIQEIKVEFFISGEVVKINKISSPSLFALKSNQTYNIVPLNYLLGDKLTTLGPKTIGIPMERSDEQIKQIYDVISLLEFNYKNIDFQMTKEHFTKRARLECSYRNIEFNIEAIFSDILFQLKELSSIDIETHRDLKKMIDDFQSLYLKKSTRRNIGEWAIVGEKLHFFVKCLANGREIKKLMNLIFSIEEKLQFDEIEGIEKGEIIKDFKKCFIEEFTESSRYPIKILKGKNQKRVFWGIVSTDNITKINMWIDNFKKDRL